MRRGLDIDSLESPADAARGDSPSSRASSHRSPVSSSNTSDCPPGSSLLRPRADLRPTTNSIWAPDSRPLPAVMAHRSVRRPPRSSGCLRQFHPRAHHPTPAAEPLICWSFGAASAPSALAASQNAYSDKVERAFMRPIPPRATSSPTSAEFGTLRSVQGSATGARGAERAGGAGPSSASRPQKSGTNGRGYTMRYFHCKRPGSGGSCSPLVRIATREGRRRALVGNAVERVDEILRKR